MSYSTDTWYILFGFFLASGNICYHWDTFFPMEGILKCVGGGSHTPANVQWNVF